MSNTKTEPAGIFGLGDALPYAKSAGMYSVYSPPCFISCRPSIQPLITVLSTTGTSKSLPPLLESNTSPLVRRPSYSTLTKSPLAMVAPVPSFFTLYCRPEAVVCTPSLDLLASSHCLPAAAAASASLAAAACIFSVTAVITACTCSGVILEGVPAIWSSMAAKSASLSIVMPLFFRPAKSNWVEIS